MSTYLNKAIFGYSVMTLLCGALAIIYEFLGHGVYTSRIRLLFLFPLLMMVICLLLRKVNFEKFLPAFTALRMLVASEIARNAFVGIIFVYGTISSKATIFAIISCVLAVLTVILTIICAFRKNK